MDGKVREVIYYSAGFFGYGEKGDFQQWSLAHILPILLAIGAIVFIWFKKDRIREWKHERTFRFIYAFIMILCEMSYFWRLVYVGPGTDPDKTMMSFLPLQVCQWTLICTTFMMMSESKKLFNLSFFLTMSAGILPLLFPAVISAMGPRYYRYYQYWGEHLLPIVGMFYMMFVHRYEVKPYGIPLTIGALFCLAIPCIYFNGKYEDAQYLYLKHGDYSMLDFLPDSILLTGAVLLAAVLILLGLDYLIYRLATKGSKALKS
ncbi:MAG: TIGR02206 family membrane protein [Spirochaetales bacterium]|nr:TIGR02206 family membrane protein [Spirochaetales bacterium]